MLYDGPSDESLFHTPYPNALLEADAPRRLPPGVELMGDDVDDRSCALVGGLLVEQELDRILSAWLPQYNKLADSRDFPFSAKIELLRSTALVPKKMCSGAHIVKQVRNKFAHGLSLKSFEKLPANLTDSLRDSVTSFTKDEKLDKYTRRGLLKATVIHVGVGLYLYTYNVRSVRMLARDPATEKKLRTEARRLFDQTVNEAGDSTGAAKQ